MNCVRLPIAVVVYHGVNIAIFSGANINHAIAAMVHLPCIWYVSVFLDDKPIGQVQFFQRQTLCVDGGACPQQRNHKQRANDLHAQLE